MSQEILFSVSHGIGRLTLNRPMVYNALSFEMWDELNELLHKIEYDESIRCLLIGATGENFCAGTDIRDLDNFTGLTAPERAAFYSSRCEAVNRVFMAIERLPQPVLASVRGVAYGGGFGMAVAPDLVIASETARFAMATIDLGSIPDCGVAHALVRTMGLKKAKQYLVLGDTLTADEAADFGLVNWVVPNADLDREADAIATRLAARPRLGAKLAKAMVNNAPTRTLTETLQQEAWDTGPCVMDAEYVSRVDAFISKRKAAKAVR